MTISLRPMGLGEILDRGVQMMTSNLALFTGIAVFPGMASLAQTISSNHPHDISGSTFLHTLLVLASYGASFVTWIASLVLTALGGAVACVATSKLLLDEPITIRAAYALLAPQSGRMVWLGFLQGLFAAWPLIIVTYNRGISWRYEFGLSPEPNIMDIARGIVPSGRCCRSRTLRQVCPRVPLGRHREL